MAMMPSMKLQISAFSWQQSSTSTLQTDLISYLLIYVLVFVLLIIYVGCRIDVPDHTICGFVMYIVLYSGVVGIVNFLNKLYSFYASVA